MPDAGSAAGQGGRWARWWSEPAVHGVVAIAGAGIALLIVGFWSPTLAWRSAAIAVALSLVVAGSVAIVRLGRAEWRRERPPGSDYLPPVARFVLAFLLVVTATS